MDEGLKPCCYCDGEGITPSYAYIRWHKCPKEYEKKFLEDNPVEMCPHCKGDKELLYIDGEKERFNSLLDRWERETSNSSSPGIKHPCFIEVNKMKSKEAIGWLLERMEKEITLAISLLDRWINKKDSPITENTIEGKMQLITDEWIKWGKKKGFLK